MCAFSLTDRQAPFLQSPGIGDPVTVWRLIGRLLFVSLFLSLSEALQPLSVGTQARSAHPLLAVRSTHLELRDRRIAFPFLFSSSPYPFLCGCGN